jgi:hypothetical protein
VLSLLSTSDRSPRCNIGALNIDYSAEVNQGDVPARIESSSFETRGREEEADLAVARTSNPKSSSGHRITHLRR